MFHLKWVVTLVFLSVGVMGNIYMTDNNRVIEITGRTKPCIVHSDRKTVTKMLQNHKSYNMQRMSPAFVQDFVAACTDVEKISSQGGFSIPGTKWCGPGNTANGYNDVGPLVEEDKCCREHDHCPQFLEPGQCRHQICNHSPFTMSHCDCDETFRTCLKRTNSKQADFIGQLYFNFAHISCFKTRRACPSYMRKDTSYTWFCDEWKLVPVPEFTTERLDNPAAALPAERIPDPPSAYTLNTSIDPHSAIDDNLNDLYEKEPNIENVMRNGKDYAVINPVEKHIASVLNSIPNGHKIWRD